MPSSEPEPSLRITLTTTGRRSGEPRSVPLFAFEDGDGWVVVASKGGFPRDPAWAENLRADPRATVKIVGATLAVRAREVGAADRDRLWTLVTTGFKPYLHYERKARRPIPLFMLERVEP